MICFLALVSCVTKYIDLSEHRVRTELKRDSGLTDKDIDCGNKRKGYCVAQKGVVEYLYPLPVWQKDKPPKEMTTEKIVNILKSAQSGNVEDQIKISTIFTENEKIFSKDMLDRKTVEKWLFAAADNEERDAYFPLAKFYYAFPESSIHSENDFTEKHKKVYKDLPEIQCGRSVYNREAIFWYDRAVRYSNSNDSMKAQNNMAILCKKSGKTNLFIDLYTQAADMGLGLSQHGLARMLYNGEMVPQDKDKALFYWKSSLPEFPASVCQLQKHFNTMGDIDALQEWKNYEKKHYNIEFCGDEFSYGDMKMTLVHAYKYRPIKGKK